jgi:hypothetical protein
VIAYVRIFRALLFWLCRRERALEIEFLGHLAHRREHVALATSSTVDLTNVHR